MPLSWNEIKDRALRFSREWADEASEHAEAKSFWDGFFDVFGVSRRRVANFEKHVRKIDGKDGYIDLLWKGVLLVEHKSRGKDLDRAHTQARDYFHGLADAELPRYLLVSDFARFRLYDLEGEDAPAEFALKDLHRNVRRFGFIAGYQPRSFKDEDPVNIEAAERMGKLHDALKAAGYAGHELEVLLVRVLFCLFADDTGIFPRNAFHELIAQRTAVDGSDLGAWLASLFQVLDTARDQRQTTLDEQLGEFPYVNGKLFAEPLRHAAFDARMRVLLLEAAGLDWSRISPAIFGSMFQSVMDAKARRNLGAHYTSEKNILKLIGPLFLDELKAELEKIGNHDAKLKSFHVKLSNLRFLDPACGCGNFLVIAYRELRQLELEVLRRQFAQQQSVLTRVAEHVAVDVDQFYGIEIEEFPAQIAQVALWLMDHQMNLRVAEQFGEYFARLPLTKAPTIVNDNALRVDWNDVVPKEELSYILGNPPFVGKQHQSAGQKTDMERIFKGVKGAGVLDFVTAWYLLAARYVQGTSVRCAFVSTNSIAQGEQVGVLWRELCRLGVHIQFAHRTFKWSNEARGKAAVYCVIIGFGCEDPKPKRLFDYEDVRGEPQELVANNINAYLVDAPDVALPNRRNAICNVAPIVFGSMPNDGGHLLLSGDERRTLVQGEPDAVAWIRPFLGAHEFINGIKRWCLWLDGISPNQLRALPRVAERVAAVKAHRETSNRETTRQLAAFPTRFGEDRQPHGPYVLVPRHSSENRLFIPLGFVAPDVICGDSNMLVPDATLLDFGVLQSTMQMAWVRYVCGRLKSDFRYSAGIVYNNFPWPELAFEPLSPRERGRGEGMNSQSGDDLPSSGAARHHGAPGQGWRLYPEGEAKVKIPLPAEALAFARNLRRHTTDAETTLWHLLRNRQLGGFKFRRQHPLPPYTLDFYCEAAKLCVELDGGQHGDEPTRDAKRDAFLREQGVRTLRIWNNEVFGNLEGVLEAIWNALHEPPSPPAPLPEGEGSRAASLVATVAEGEGSRAASLAATLAEGKGSTAASLAATVAKGEGSKHRAAIEAAAQGVLDARAQFPDATLADLYDPLSMPPALVKAHQALDRAVDAAYIAAEKAAGRKAPRLASDAERVAFLFGRYQALTSLLPLPKKTPRRRRSKAPASP